MSIDPVFYKSFLEQELARRSERNSQYSLRSFAKSLGLVPSALSEILAGKRLPSPKMAQKILGKLNTSPEENAQFFQSLALAHQQRSAKRLSPTFKERNLQRLKPPTELSIELFRVISEWYHAAILELTFVEDFQSNPRWIATELGISPIEAKLAIGRLLKLGLLEKKSDRLVKSSEQLTTSDKQLTDPALKKMQKQCLEAAIYSLDHDPIGERNITTMTMAIAPEKISKAKEKIKKFNRELCLDLESGSRKRVL